MCCRPFVCSEFRIQFSVCKKQVHTHVDIPCYIHVVYTHKPSTRMYDTHTCSTCVRTCAHDISTMYNDIHHIFVFVLKTEDEEVPP